MQNFSYIQQELNVLKLFQKNNFARLQKKYYERNKKKRKRKKQSMQNFLTYCKTGVTQQKEKSVWFVCFFFFFLF